MWKRRKSIELVNQNLREDMYRKVYAHKLPNFTVGFAKVLVEMVNFYAIILDKEVLIREQIILYYHENDYIPKECLTERNSDITMRIPKKYFTKYFSLEKVEYHG